ncbi:MAG: type I-D CRISPR-associated protein Cas7/Csc2 [Candidatus Syntropharchaeia archaeon]
MNNEVMGSLNGYFVKSYSEYPQANYISVVLLRKTESETILRTEGSGEGLNEEMTYAGLEDNERIMRVIFSKRKQVAVERRTGRELLRKFELLGYYDNGNFRECKLNMNEPCGRCMDCMVYGYAVGDGGAQKSRVLYENAYSVLASQHITSTKTFNAIYENGTMRKPGTGQASASINSDKYVIPETYFADVVTFRDLTEAEFIYSVGNILRSRRYGAISSRMGKMTNFIVAIVASNYEVFSSLELTKKIYDHLKTNGEVRETPDVQEMKKIAEEGVNELVQECIGERKPILQDELEGIISFVKSNYDNEETIKEILKKQSESYPKR